jgi:ankyrin repeat protein
VQAILDVSEGPVNQRDEKGRTALHYASAEGSTDCVRTLLTVRSCDIHSRDSRGTTPLHWAAAANQPSVLQLLLRRGADRSLRDSDEMTAVEHAEVRGHTECAHILHNYGLRRPSSALSVASQVSVHATPPPSLDKHGHVTLALPQRRFSLFHSSLPRPPADGQAHPDTLHTHGDEIPNTPTHTVQQVRYYSILS